MTVEDLRQMAEKERERQARFSHRVLTCAAAGCISWGGEAVRDALRSALKEKGLERQVEVLGTGCMGLCGRGPMVKVQSDETRYIDVDAAAARRDQEPGTVVAVVQKGYLLHDRVIRRALVMVAREKAPPAGDAPPSA